MLLRSIKLPWIQRQIVRAARKRTRRLRQPRNPYVPIFARRPRIKA